MVKKKEQVFSKHMTGKKTREQLEQFNSLLVEMMGSTDGKKGALEQLRVLEIGHANFPGLVCGAMLGEMGADVIKIEAPQGDAAREATHHGRYIRGVGIPFVMESRNKLLLSVNFEDEQGIGQIKKLAAKADIIIDAMKPGYLDELGIGYRQLSEGNPGLIYASVSPYGHYTKKERIQKHAGYGFNGSIRVGLPGINGGSHGGGTLQSSGPRRSLGGHLHERQPLCCRHHDGSSPSRPNGRRADGRHGDL